VRQKKEVIKYYSNISKKYERVRLGTLKGKIISDLQIDWFIKNLGNAKYICLEIGCGTGRVTRILVRRTNLLVATDASMKMIDINKSSINDKLKEKTEYIQCDALHLPFRGESFDSIIGARVFWHLDYIKAFQEAFRLLKANRQLLFDFPSLFGPLSLYSKFRRINHEVLMEFITRSTIRNIFRKAKHLIILGNTSLLLFFMPSKLLKKRVAKRLIYLFEEFDYGFLKDFLYSYYLVKVIK